MPQKVPWPKDYFVGFWGRSSEGDILLNYAKYKKELLLQFTDWDARQVAQVEWWSRYPDLLNVLYDTAEVEKNPFWTKTFTLCETYFKDRLPLEGAVIVTKSIQAFTCNRRGNFCSPHLLHSPEAVSSMQGALNQENPFLFDERQEMIEKPTKLFLFGSYLWKTKQVELAAEPEHFRLLFLEAVDRDRLQLERLRNKFSGVAGAKLERSREPIQESVRIFVWRRDGGKCVRCGKNERLEFDHIIPLAEGGSNTERNLQLLCEVCNRGKGAKI
jgi:hypothetical protein